MERKIRSLTSRCQAKIYHFKQMVLGDGSGVSGSGVTDAEIIEIKSDDNSIVSFDFEKNIDSCSGVFSLVLTPSINWMTKIRPGDWISISLNHDGNLSDQPSSVRCLGNVDRVAQSEVVQKDGRRVITYVVTGRDFGKVLEKYSVWFNNFSEGASTQYVKLEKAFDIVGKPNDILNEILDVFLGGQLESNSSGTTLDAWRIPKQLSSDFGGRGGGSLGGAFSLSGFLGGGGGGGTKFNDILVRNFDSVGGYKQTSPSNLIIGSLWEMMKIYSNPVINELFTELENVNGQARPSVYLRMYPFTNNNGPKPSGVGHVTTFEGTTFPVRITGADIISSNIGVADHDRVNLVFLHGLVPAEKNTTEIALFSDPFVNKASARRYGLNSYIVPTDFIASTNANQVPQLVRGWNELLKNWYLENTNLESGSFQIIGNENVKVGRRLVVTESKSHNNKHFYIEGYSDSWSYPGIWTQQVRVTRGQYMVNNGSGSDLTINHMDEKTDLYGQTNVKGGRK